MTGYLGRLVDRAVGRAAVLTPRVRSRFEPGRTFAHREPAPSSTELEAGGDARQPPASAAPSPALAALEPRRAGAPGDPPAPGAAPRQGLRAHPPEPERPAAPPRLEPAPAARREDAGEPGEALHARLRAVADAAERLLAEARQGRGVTDGDAGAAARPGAPASPGAPLAIAPPPRRRAEPPHGDALRPDHPLAQRPPAAPPPLRLPGPPAAREPHASRAAAPEAAPAVHVTIGRVEVRAAVPAAPAAAAVPRRAAGHLGLDEYLRRREEGGR